MPNTIHRSSAKKVASNTQPACPLIAHANPTTIAPQRVTSMPSAATTANPLVQAGPPSAVMKMLAPKISRPAIRVTNPPTRMPGLSSSFVIRSLV